MTTKTRVAQVVMASVLIVVGMILHAVSEMIVPMAFSPADSTPFFYLRVWGPYLGTWMVVTAGAVWLLTLIWTWPTSHRRGFEV